MYGSIHIPCRTRRSREGASWNGIALGLTVGGLIILLISFRLNAPPRELLSNESEPLGFSSVANVTGNELVLAKEKKTAPPTWLPVHTGPPPANFSPDCATGGNDCCRWHWPGDPIARQSSYHDLSCAHIGQAVNSQGSGRDCIAGFACRYCCAPPVSYLCANWRRSLDLTHAAAVCNTLSNSQTSHIYTKEFDHSVQRLEKSTNYCSHTSAHNTVYLSPNSLSELQLEHRWC